MGIFDIFTGNAAKKAANQQRSYLDQVQANAQPGIDAAQNQSLGYIGQGTDTASNYLTSGYGNAQGAVNSGADAALGRVQGGADAAQGYLAGGAAAYQPLSDLATRYGGATSLGMDALGVNGAAGNSRAVDAFHAGPGYNFQVDQGLEAINRRRNAGGMLASGNADRDAQTFGQGLANQEFNNWRTGLNSYAPLELSATSGAASGRAGIAGQQANAATGAGNTLAGLESGRGSSLSDLFTRGAGAQAGLYSGEGSSLSNIVQGAEGQRLGLTGAVLQPYNNTYGQEAAATQQGSQNLWNLGLNAAALGTGQFGKFAGAK